MSEMGYSASKTASKIAEKLVEILDVFDLSFFMSGAVATAALLVYFEPSIERQLDQHTGLSLFGLVLGSYVLGLVCFAIGRWGRDQVLPDDLTREFRDALEQHGLLGAGPEAGAAPGDAIGAELRASLDRYFGDGRPVTPATVRMAMYTRMWVHVRSYPELSESFALLKRYWILAASYDGVAAAALVWLLPVWTRLAASSPDLRASLGWTLALVVASGYCWHRAREYKRYQVEELVATVAHWLRLVGRPTLAALESMPAPRDPPPSS